MGGSSDLRMRTIIALAIVLAFVQYSAADGSVPEEELTQVAGKYHGCTVRCHQSPCQVIVFQHCNYHGYHIHLRPGNYNMMDLQRRGMKNDDLSSIQVHGNCKATLFEHWNFSGKHFVKTRHDSCFTNDHMVAPSLKALSIKVEEHKPKAASTTELVQSEAKASWGRRRRRRRARRRRSWNDQVSSIKVFNKNGRYCKMDCRERDHKLKIRAEKAAKAKKVKKEKAAKAKIAADKKREKAFKKKMAARKKKIEKKVKAARKRWALFRKKERAGKKKRRAIWRKKWLKIRKKMNKRFRKNKKKLGACAKKVKGRLANYYKGRCIAFRRFCRHYRKMKHNAAKYYCRKMRLMHRRMKHHHRRHRHRRHRHYRRKHYRHHKRRHVRNVRRL